MIQSAKKSVRILMKLDSNGAEWGGLGKSFVLKV